MGGLTSSLVTTPSLFATQTQGYTHYHVVSLLLTESFTINDAVAPIGTGVDVSAGIVADMPAFGVIQRWVTGSLAGTIIAFEQDTTMLRTSTAQFVSEINVNA